MEQKIGQLQLLEQNMQNFLMQRQQFQSQLVEVESALKELETSEDAYKIIGNIMVKSKKEDLQKDLKEKQEMLNLRVAAIEKQEATVKEKAQALQQEVMGKMKEEKK